MTPYAHTLSLLVRSVLLALFAVAVTACLPLPLPATSRAQIANMLPTYVAPRLSAVGAINHGYPPTLLPLYDFLQAASMAVWDPAMPLAPSRTFGPPLHDRAQMR